MTYGELVWSVSINNDDFFVYSPATRDFIEFAQSNGIDAAENQEVDPSNIRRLTLAFGKVLRVKIRQEHPCVKDLAIVLGEAEWVDPGTVPKAELRAAVLAERVRCADLAEEQRCKILDNPSDPSWTEHLAEVTSAIYMGKTPEVCPGSHANHLHHASHYLKRQETCHGLDGARSGQEGEREAGGGHPDPRR